MEEIDLGDQGQKQEVFFEYSQQLEGGLAQNGISFIEAKVFFRLPAVKFFTYLVQGWQPCMAELQAHILVFLRIILLL